MRHAPLLSALAALILAAPATRGGDGRVHTSNPVVFERLFRKAKCDTTRLIILGDSQETCPIDAGEVYIPRLQYEFWLRAGNTPETPVIIMGQSMGSGFPYADWLMRVSNPSGGVTPFVPSGGVVPPGMQACRTSTAGNSTVNPAQVYGQLVQLQHDAGNVHPGTELRNAAAFFRRDGDVYAEVFAMTAPGSGEVALRVMPAESAVPSFFRPVVQTFTSQMGLDENGPMQVRSQQFGPLNYNGLAFMNVEYRGTAPDRFTEILGVRYRNASHPTGWSITSFSQGGYSASHLLALHGACGPALGAFKPDAAVLMYGANDASESTPAKYRNDLAALIAFVRASTDAELPIIIIPDAYRDGLMQWQQTNMAGFVASAIELTLTDPNVAVVDSRGELEQLGWASGTTAQYLSDGVHYTAAGAILKAQVDARLLFDAFGAMVDCNGNGIEDACDIRNGTATDADGDGVIDACDCDADYNADGGADTTDVLDLANDIATGMQSFPPRDADFNLDGGADTTDVLDMANRIAGAECP